MIRLASRPGAPARAVVAQLFRPRLESLEDRTTPSTFTVNTTVDESIAGDGKLSLREAITKANTTAGADAIVVPAGVYKIALEDAGEDGNTKGDFDILGAVTIQGAGAGLTIIDGQQIDRVFDVIGSGPHSIKPVLQGLTVRGGNATGDGGGIQVANADLVMRDCSVAGNRASLTGGGIAGLVGSPVVKLVRTAVARNIVEFDGGGVHAITATLTNCMVRRNSVTQGIGGGVLASTATLTSCIVSGNSAGTGGGGIRVTTLNLSNSTVSGNCATSDTSQGAGIWADKATLTKCIVSGNTATAKGGGIFADTLTLTNSTVSGNSSIGNAAGGGIFADTVTLTNSTVSGNTTGGSGGGIFADTVTLTNSTVSGNFANVSGGGVGGGIVAVNAATLTNTTISGNVASYGGGIDAPNAATLVNCTIAENYAHAGGGVFHDVGGTFSVKNTIIAQNLVDFSGAGPDLSGDFTSQGHNLIGDGTGGSGFTNGDLVGTSLNPIDPKLGPLANNGGPTRTMALLAGSKAIDRGDNAAAPATDQRGLPRKKDGNGDGKAIVDIGAFER